MKRRSEPRIPANKKWLPQIRSANINPVIIKTAR